MGRGKSNTSAARSASAKRRGKASRRGATGGLSADARAFINGTADKVTITLDPTKVAKGPEHVLGSSGTGAHGKAGRAKHRSDRKSVKQSLRRGDW